MIQIVFYTEKADDLPILKSSVEAFCNDIVCSYHFFEYPMDVLDHINKAHPDNCAVFYQTEDLEYAFEMSKRINMINPGYKFNLLSSNFGNDVERLFKSGITYYIKTPFKTDSILSCTECIKACFNEQHSRTIILKNKKGEDAVSLSDIKYIMSDKRKITVYSEKYERSYYYKLDEIEPMLGSGFLRCHQSFIVNMKLIKEFVEDGLYIYDNEFIPVSRKKYFASKKLYLSYITGNKIE